MTPPAPAIHLTAEWPDGTTTEATVDPDDAAAFAAWTSADWKFDDPYSRVRVAVAHLLTPTEEQA